MKKALLALLLALCLVGLSSCSQTAESILAMVGDKAESSGADALARQFIDGLLTNDPEKSHAVFVEDVEMAQVLELFPTMQKMLPDADAYTLTPTSWNSTTSNGVTQTAFQFQLVMGEQTFMVQTLQVSNTEGLYNIHIAPYTPEAKASAAGSGKTNIAEIAFQLFGLVATILVIWALVDCCRHKFKRRWLWILLILLGNIMIAFALSGSQVRLNFRFGFHLTTNYLSMSENGFSTQWMLPVGALVYMLRRKRLIQPPAKGFAEAFASTAPETQHAPNHEPTE